MNNAQKLRKLYKKTQNDIADIISYPKPLYAAFELNKLKLPHGAAYLRLFAVLLP